MTRRALVNLSKFSALFIVSADKEPSVQEICLMVPQLVHHVRSDVGRFDSYAARGTHIVSRSQ